MKRNTFKVGSGCYECCCCGKRTRDTSGEGDLRLCKRCEITGDIENAYSDHKSLFNGSEMIEYQVTVQLNDMKMKELVELMEYIQGVIRDSQM